MVLQLQSCKKSVQAGHKDTSGRVMAKKRERLFRLYLDNNTFNLCNPYSELMFWIKLLAAEALNVLSVLLHIVYFIHKDETAAVTHLTDKKITLTFLPCMPSNSVLCFFTRKANVLLTKSFWGYRSMIYLFPNHSLSDLHDWLACSRETV